MFLKSCNQSSCIVLLLVTALSLSLINVNPVQADDNRSSYYYVSPGMRIGYIFGGGVNLSAEVSVGTTGWDHDFGHTAIAVGGELLGGRHKKNLKGIYTSLQGGYGLTGASGGLLFYKEDGQIKIGGRFAGYAGVGFAFVSVNHLWFPSKSEHITSIGPWFKYPFMENGFYSDLFFGDPEPTDD